MTVLNEGVFTTIPSSASTQVGQAFTFSVKAKNVKSYYWMITVPRDPTRFFVKSVLEKHGVFEGFATNTITITPSDVWLQGKLITCKVTLTDGTVIYSPYATMTVNPSTTPPTTPIPTPSPTPEEGTLLKDASGIYEVTGKETVAFQAPHSGKSVVYIPATVTIDGNTYQVTEIADGACMGNTNLKAVEIETGVKKIGKKAFYGCTSLTSFETGSNVKTIGSYAFYNCKKLTEITLHTKLTTIGTKAFYKCKSLKKIVIKTSKLTKSSIGSKAFAKGYSKVRVNVPTAKLETYPKILKAKGMSSKAKYY